MQYEIRIGKALQLAGSDPLSRGFRPFMRRGRDRWQDSIEHGRWARRAPGNDGFLGPVFFQEPAFAREYWRKCALAQGPTLPRARYIQKCQ